MKKKEYFLSFQEHGRGAVMLPIWKRQKQCSQMRVMMN